VTDPHAARPLARSLALLAAIVGLSAPLVAGCARGGPTADGDTPATPAADEYGEGQHISSKIGGFFGPATWLQPMNESSIGCTLPPVVNVFTTGVTVTAVDNYDETNDGAIGSVYVQDTVPNPPLYAGMSLFDPSFTPPDLRVFPGNVLDVVGPYEEYLGPDDFTFPQCETLPQLGGAATFRFDGVVPAAVEITPDDLNSYVGARQYLGMLVKVEGVTISKAGSADSSNRYEAQVSVTSGSNFTIANQLFDLGTQMPLAEGAKFKSVTGIVTYFGSIQISPRSTADFEM
jgi:hypothetical protein